MKTTMICLAVYCCATLGRADSVYVSRKSCHVYDGNKIKADLRTYTAILARPHPKDEHWLIVQWEGKPCTVETKYLIRETDLERELDKTQRDLAEKKQELEIVRFDRDMAKRAYQYEFYLPTTYYDVNSNRVNTGALSANLKADYWRTAKAAENRAETLKKEITELEAKLPALEKLMSAAEDFRRQ